MAPSCERCRDLLGSYLEGVLEPGDREALGEHLRLCSDCRAVLEGCQRLPSLLRRATDVPMPPALRRRLVRSLRAALQGSGRSRPARK